MGAGRGTHRPAVPLLTSNGSTGGTRGTRGETGCGRCCGAGAVRARRPAEKPLGGPRPVGDAGGMVEREAAVRAVTEELDREYRQARAAGADPERGVVTHAEAHPLVWIVHWTLEAYARTGDPRRMPVGHGAFLVDRIDGGLRTIAQHSRALRHLQRRGDGFRTWCAMRTSLQENGEQRGFKSGCAHIACRSRLH